MSLRKKRKLDEAEDGEYVGEIIADVDLEISLRQRLAEALESKITWALILQETLNTGTSRSFNNDALILYIVNMLSQAVVARQPPSKMQHSTLSPQSKLLWTSFSPAKLLH